MTLKRSLVQALDRPPFRPLLACFATAYARKLLAKDVAVKFRQGWYHTVDGVSIPDNNTFDMFKPHVESWRDQIETFFRDTREMWFIGYTPKPGDTIIDVGAGRGEDVLAFANEVGAHGRVIAIEAHPQTFNQLRRLCELNENLRHVTPLQLAIMDRECMVSIESTDAWESNTISTVARQESVSVPAVTLDQLCKQYGIPYIDFLKMNIEGAEKFAIKGMSEMVSRTKCVCICCHDFRAERGDGDFYRTREETVTFLLANGFRIFSRPDSPFDYVRDHIFGIRD